MLFVFCGKTQNSFPHLIMYTTKRNIPTALMLASATVLVVVLMLAAGAPVAEAGSIPPPHCNPDVSDALPPRLRRICAALYGIAEISNAVEQYLDEKSKSKCGRIPIYCSIGQLVATVQLIANDGSNCELLSSSLFCSSLQP